MPTAGVKISLGPLFLLAARPTCLPVPSGHLRSVHTYLYSSQSGTLRNRRTEIAHLLLAGNCAPVGGASWRPSCVECQHSFCVARTNAVGTAGQGAPSGRRAPKQAGMGTCLARRRLHLARNANGSPGRCPCESHGPDLVAGQAGSGPRDNRSSSAQQHSLVGRQTAWAAGCIHARQLGQLGYSVQRHILGSQCSTTCSVLVSAESVAALPRPTCFTPTATQRWASAPSSHTSS